MLAVKLIRPRSNKYQGGGIDASLLACGNVANKGDGTSRAGASRGTGYLLTISSVGIGGVQGKFGTVVATGRAGTGCLGCAGT